MQMMTHPTEFRLGIRKTSEIFVGHECRAYDFVRLNRLTRGCADIDIYSVAWALSSTCICQRGRSDCRSKWGGRLCNYILHELFADRTYLLGQRGAKHHDLLAVRRASEYLLYVPAHIYNSNAAQLIIYYSKNATLDVDFKEAISNSGWWKW